MIVKSGSAKSSCCKSQIVELVLETSLNMFEQKGLNRRQGVLMRAQELCKIVETSSLV